MFEKWELLPPDLKKQILFILPVLERVPLRTVSKSFCALIDYDFSWKQAVQEIADHQTLPETFTSWKELYIHYYKSCTWSKTAKGPYIELANNSKTAISVDIGGWGGNRITSYYWQMALSAIQLSPEFNYGEMVIDAFDHTLQNTRGIMIGISSDKCPVSEEFSPCWLGLDGGWGYAAKSGELFLPGSRSHHAHRDFSSPYGKGDVIGVLLDFQEKRLAFFVNGALRGTEQIMDKHWSSSVNLAMAAAHGRTTVSLRIPKLRQSSIQAYEKHKQQQKQSPKTPSEEKKSN